MCHAYVAIAGVIGASHILPAAAADDDADVFVYSAKELLAGESNVAYICSRYYRAPELILGATDYTIQIGSL